MRVLAAPGPVSYPVIVNNRGIEHPFLKMELQMLYWIQQYH
ncbi:DUF3834 domain-containing protein [Sulfolobaceae archaeon RB850M]